MTGTRSRRCSRQPAGGAADPPARRAREAPARRVHTCLDPRTPASGPNRVTTKRSKIPSVNGALPTTIIVAGLAFAGGALLMTVLNRRMGGGLLGALCVLEILLLIEVGLIVAKLADGGRPASLPTLIGYLCATPLVPVAAGFWGAMERSRWGPAVIAVAGLVAAVLMVRLHQIWPIIRV